MGSNMVETARSFSCQGQELLSGRDRGFTHLPRSVWCRTNFPNVAVGLDLAVPRNQQLHPLRFPQQNLDPSWFASLRCQCWSRRTMQNALGLETGYEVHATEELEPLITEARPKMPSKPGWIFQAFGWKAHLKVDGRTFYERMIHLAPELKASGFTHVLFPPCSKAADPQGTLFRIVVLLSSVLPLAFLIPMASSTPVPAMPIVKLAVTTVL